jgi:hypothetical protein
MKELESFMRKHPPNRRQSKLKPFQNEILEMYEAGYKVEQIQEWLARNQVNVSVRAINKFKKNLNKKSSSLKTPKKVKNKGKLKEVNHKATNAFFNNLDKYKTTKNKGEEI